MKMRVKLQKFLQQKEERDVHSFEMADACLNQVELIPLNAEFYEHLKVFKKKIFVFISSLFRLPNWEKF
jgi:hypothetical protein